MNTYCIIENNLVVNVTTANDDFAQSQGWILCPEGVGIGWGYDGTTFTPPANPTPEEIQQQNKQQATQLLQQTDWTATVDINNPQYSNPYLMNQDAFLAYRSQVRAIAVNPPTTPVAFPTMPTEVWSN
jgi:hypothetical protein